MRGGIESFEQHLTQVFDGAGLRHRAADQRIISLMASVQGMASLNKLELLAFVSSYVAEDEIYLEAGCWQGLSTIAASLNFHGSIVAVDNFAQFGGPREKFHRNLADWGRSSQVEFHDGDFFELVRQGLLTGRKVGVYFYDAGHTYEDQYLALARVEPYLSGEAVVVIDDTADRRVRRATQLYVSRHSAYRLLFEARKKGRHDQTWWNGVQVYGYRRSGFTASGISVRDQSNTIQFKTRLLMYDLAYARGLQPAAAHVRSLLAPIARPVLARVRHRAEA